MFKVINCGILLLEFLLVKELCFLNNKNNVMEKFKFNVKEIIELFNLFF